jgi:hypothetical protein
MKLVFRGGKAFLGVSAAWRAIFQLGLWGHPAQTVTFFVGFIEISY